MFKTITEVRSFKYGHSLDKYANLKSLQKTIFNLIDYLTTKFKTELLLGMWILPWLVVNNKKHIWRGFKTVLSCLTVNLNLFVRGCL